MSAVKGMLSDLTRWQVMLHRHSDILLAVQPGCGLGLLLKTEPHPSQALVWRASDCGMVAEIGDFRGFKDTDLDLILVCREEGVAKIYAALDEHPFSALKLGLRRGLVLPFLMKRRSDLIDHGWGGLLEILGIAFLGACR